VAQGEIYLPFATFEPNMLPIFNVDLQIFVNATEDADLEQLGEKLEELVADLPTVAVQDLEEFTEAQTGPVNIFLNIVYGLLALAIIIALIGITNTLSLSVLERTRELGLLRAVGMSRRQLKRMVRVEAAIIAVFGTLIGLVIGIVFSIALTVAISADTPDLFTYRLPVFQLVVITVVAALAGIAAAWLPARRAAKLNVLDAISSV
jgi:putative ABC transport system permease protein